MTEHYFEVENVSKTIKGKTLLHPLSFALSEGKVLALCGGNGAGKSTLLKMIAGISRPTTGTIRLMNIEPERDRTAYAERLGFMPDDFQFSVGLSAWDTLQFYAGLRGVGKRRVAEVLERVGLTAARNQSVTSFSKGMRQRLLFAQSLLAEPALLVLDEPTNGLDPFWMESFIHLLQEIKQAKQTVIFSTHQLDVATAAADEVLFLNGGKAISQGSVASYLQQYPVHGLTDAFADSLRGQYHKDPLH
ncbi:ABC transporter ATP-binding protein [Tumebacillus algifaecis]|uniref:ABC transporter ATP-binding protein n=1 Tax=Tumebacillus algifaecis TaxID=1214604 RepID=A0A223D586_9BACL|nr:ABC transporter ATP-binding protein [Tumebacillus algifaecis]ASS76758.1 ABC transporter ATP-binding protein [Tumebacillus algifaecis]